ncbi:hypothetical protein X975_04376, partial [Stegodyphus mimosarum]
YGSHLDVVEDSAPELHVISKKRKSRKQHQAQQVKNRYKYTK